MRGLSMLRIVLALPPALVIAACGGDAREASPPGYGEPSPGELRDDTDTSTDTATPTDDLGPSALHRAEGEVCPNLREEDFCFVDDDCRTGGPCLCGGRADSYRWNICAEGNCHTDADCGEGGRCSPSPGCGGFAGYYCHGPEDACADDRDCFDPALGQSECLYQANVERWACGNLDCPVF